MFSLFIVLKKRKFGFIVVYVSNVNGISVILNTAADILFYNVSNNGWNLKVKWAKRFLAI